MKILPGDNCMFFFKIMTTLKLVFVCCAMLNVVTASSIWKEILAPDNPPLFRVRSYENPESLNNYAVLDFIGLVERHRYPAEEHKITTEDGYRLVFHRIPGSPRSNSSSTGKKVVFLQHGILSSSDVWVFSGPERSIAFQLADAGYDVWLGNVRGNSYCRSHAKLKTSDRRFWEFSYHENAVYDLRSMIDYVLNYTRNDKLYYIGHSMGTTMSYVLLSMKPEYNEKIRLVVSLSPVAFWNRRLSPLMKFLRSNAHMIMRFFELNGIDNVAPQSAINVIIGRVACSESNFLFQTLCLTALYSSAGSDPLQTDTKTLPYFISYFPAGSSVKTLIHYAQNLQNGNFQLYDHGDKDNYRIYKQKGPPVYDLKKITAPVFLIYGKNDALAPPENVFELKKRLPNVVAAEAVPYDSFNHLDFIIAIDVKTLINDRIIEIINDF